MLCEIHTFVSWALWCLPLGRLPLPPPPVFAADISLQIQGDSIVDENAIVTGDLAVGGQITAGSGENILTNAAGLIDGTKLQSGTVGASQLAAGAAGESALADGAATEAKIAANAVTAGKIAAGAVGTAQLAAGAVDSSKIADGQVAAADLASNSVSTAKIADSAVTSAKIADGQVAAADLANGAVSTDKISDSAVTSAKIGDGQVATADLANSSVIAAKIADGTVTPAKLSSSGTYCVGKMGVSTTAVPVGGVGYCKMAIHGASDILNSPYMQWTSDVNNYPIMLVGGDAHNSSAVRFDCYVGPAGQGVTWQRSACATSNGMLVKYDDALIFNYASGVALDQSFYWLTGFQMSCIDGSIKMPQVYSHAVSAPRRALYISETGQLGYASSSIRYKENVRDTTDSDTGFIYELRPVMFDYKDPAMGTNQCGLIAEEVDQVRPSIVSYERKVTYEPPSDPNDKSDILQPTVTTTNVPETVNYDQLIVPMLAEMQKLKKRVDELEAKLAALEPKNP